MGNYGDVLSAHGSLLLDEVRTHSFQQAILDTVKPGNIVLDLGCGTGVLAFFACQAGANRVFAIESGEVIESARMVSNQNGYEDQILFIKGHSKDVELTERVDVIITETLGNFGVGEGILSAIVDARRRFLKPGGAIIPSAVELYVAPVETAKVHRQIKDLWSRNLYGLDYTPIRSLALNHPSRAEFRSEDMLAKHVKIANLNLAEFERDEFQGKATWEVNRKGILHGIAGWFAVDLSPGIRFSNFPPRQNSCWEHAFFPIERHVEVNKGDEIQATIRVSENEIFYQWQVEIFRQQGTDGERNCKVIKFDHGGMKGIPQLDKWVDKFLSNVQDV
jgi:protein arginine N-methyltransferase 1